MTPKELYAQYTTELSKLQNEILNTSICSYEHTVDEMTTDQLYDAAQELLWVAKDVTNQDDLLQDDLLQDDTDDEWDTSDNSWEEILEEAERILEELADCV